MSQSEELSEHRRADEIDTGNRKFHGVYLLYCLNPAAKGKTYIGYTVDPKRRIKQHNLGTKAGGACKTSGKGPWDMILITHGFPTDVAALRFEWAWQHPSLSRHLKHLSKKTRNENQFEYRLRILSEMLRTGPWDRLPLTIQWLKQEFAKQFPARAQPPLHMPFSYGPISVSNKKLHAKPISKPKEDAESHDSQGCHICGSSKSDSKVYVECCNEDCNFRSHIVCLANSEKQTSLEKYLLPIYIKCPNCDIKLLWGDVVYGKKSGSENGYH